MANTHLGHNTRKKLAAYCEENGIKAPSDGVDALFSELSATEKENIWLRRLVAQYEETQKLLEEKIKCYQKRQKTDTTL